MSEFARDYSSRENKQIRRQLVDFDTKLVEIFNSRRDRYIRRFYPHHASTSNDSDQGGDESGGGVNALHPLFDDFEEGQHDEEVSRKNAQDFQMHDLKGLRKQFTDVLHDFLHQIDLNELKFAEERAFFLKQSLKDQEVQAQLLHKIATLETKLADEKDYAMNIFVKGEVQKSCARALIKYEFATATTTTATAAAN